jgi:ribosomal protein S18 acetylase RimI-like enzyme
MSECGSNHPVCLHERGEIEEFLRHRPAARIYELGDLDDFFWPYTTWYALRESGRVSELALLYSGTDYPVLLGMAQPPYERLGGLLSALHNLLPRRFYAHLSPGLCEIFKPRYGCEAHGLHDKMVLANPSALEGLDTTQVQQFSPSDISELEAFYRASYPGNWFDARMLETGYYYGLREEGEIVSVAGVHVYSPAYGVAALGNIATRPDLRGRGLASRVTARLCQALLDHIPLIGLNVKADNRPAIASYRKLGFEAVGQYEEWALEALTG